MTYILFILRNGIKEEFSEAGEKSGDVLLRARGIACFGTLSKVGTAQVNDCPSLQVHSVGIMIASLNQGQNSPMPCTRECSRRYSTRYSGTRWTFSGYDNPMLSTKEQEAPASSVRATSSNQAEKGNALQSLSGLVEERAVRNYLVLIMA